LSGTRARTAASGTLRLFRQVTGFREFVILLIVIVFGTVVAFQSDIFLTGQNIHAILLTLSIESIVAIGMTLLLVSGGFDLSVGSTFAFASAVTAMLLVRGAPVPAAIAAGLASGVFIGIVNGLIVAKVRVNPFITTLGMMNVVRGALLVMTGGRNISGLPGDFTRIGQWKLQIGNMQIQSPILIALVLIVVGDILLRKWRFFRQNYYIGGNERAAALSGIRVDRIKIANYALAGFSAALAGIIMTARMGAASVTAGQNLELRVISAVVIGGASLQGGEGTVLGAVLGMLLMQLIVYSLTLLGVDIYWSMLVIGTTLLVAVMIDTINKRRKGLL
jgi:ribose transport system permease protein